MRLIIDDVAEMNLILMALGSFRRSFKVTLENFYFHEAILKLKMRVQNCRDTTYINMMIHDDVWNEFLADNEVNYEN